MSQDKYRARWPNRWLERCPGQLRGLDYKKKKENKSRLCLKLSFIDLNVYKEQPCLLFCGRFFLYRREHARAGNVKTKMQFCIHLRFKNDDVLFTVEPGLQFKLM